MGKSQQTVVEAAGREVVITNPDKIFFPKAGHTKLDLQSITWPLRKALCEGSRADPLC